MKIDYKAKQKIKQNLKYKKLKPQKSKMKKG